MENKRTFHDSNRIIIGINRRPVFGICRGVQLINCYFGGTLYQDIYTEIDGVERHRFKPGAERGHIDHDVTILDNTRLAKAIGAGKISTKSWHHQSIRRVAPGFRITAKTTDGVIEAIESENYPTAGVQFHPEQNVKEQPEGRLLDLFRRMDEICRNGSPSP